MNKIRPIIFAVAVIVAALLSYCLSECLDTVNISKTAYVAGNIVAFVLFLLLVAVEILRGRVKFVSALKKAGIVAGVAVGVLAAGELVAYASAASTGAEFKLLEFAAGTGCNLTAMIISMAVLVGICVLVYVKFRQEAVRSVSSSMRVSASRNAASHHAYNLLYGAMTLVFVLSAVLFAVPGENLMFLIPLLAVTVAMILYHFTSWRVWLVASIVLVLLHAFSFLWALATALTTGALGAVAVLAFIDMMALIPLADLYLMPSQSRK